MLLTKKSEATLENLMRLPKSGQSAFLSRSERRRYLKLTEDVNFRANRPTSAQLARSQSLQSWHYYLVIGAGP